MKSYNFVLTREFMIVFSHFHFESQSFKLLQKSIIFKIFEKCFFFVRKSEFSKLFIQSDCQKFDQSFYKRHLTIFTSNETFYGIFAYVGPTVLILSDPIVDFA